MLINQNIRLDAAEIVGKKMLIEVLPWFVETTIIINKELTHNRSCPTRLLNSSKRLRSNENEIVIWRLMSVPELCELSKVRMARYSSISEVDLLITYASTPIDAC